MPQAEKMKSQLRRPSPFPDQFQEVAHLTNVHSFEGFRVDVAKAITPTFFSQQSIFFGNPQFPKGHYQVCTQYWSMLPEQRLYVIQCISEG